MVKGLFNLKPPAIIFPVNPEVEKVLDLLRDLEMNIMFQF